MFYILLLAIYLCIIFFFLIMTSRRRSRGYWITFILVTLFNIFALPMALFIGVMATDSPDSTMYDFILGFLFIQGLPLLSYFSLFLFKKK